MTMKFARARLRRKTTEPNLARYLANQAEMVIHQPAFGDPIILDQEEGHELHAHRQAGGGVSEEIARVVSLDETPNGGGGPIGDAVADMRFHVGKTAVQELNQPLGARSPRQGFILKGHPDDGVVGDKFGDKFYLGFTKD